LLHKEKLFIFPDAKMSFTLKMSFIETIITGNTAVHQSSNPELKRGRR
jgi:hypothetical protein